MSEQSVVVVAHYRAQEGNDDTVAQLLAEYAPLVQAEPGCEAFTAHRASEDPREFVLFEQYRDRAAFDAHVESVHFLEIARDRIRPMLDSRDVMLYGGALES
ncbi:MAG: antibiotic biosynthesis monooxygenase [Pseudonocardiales bacterium]|nr:antibiotic biosynthesis monooxygenase [Pseudonocardiales bacterium]